MMKYLVKTTYTATEKHPFEITGNMEVWYTGKGGVVTKERKLFETGLYDGWGRKHFAEKHIKDQLEFHNKYQSEYWDMKCEIITV